MYRLVCFFFFLMMGLSLSAQRVYYIYLQTEKEQPFVVKMGDKVYTSSSTGYLILSRLADSTYHFSVGFPGNAGPDQRFEVAIGAKNHGYLLKNFPDQGWGLFNLQTLAVAMSQSASATAVAKKETVAVSDFTNILSKAANDPSLKEKTITAPAIEEKKVVPVKEVVVKQVEDVKPIIAEKPDSKAVVEKKQDIVVVEKNEKDLRKLDSLAVASKPVIEEAIEKEVVKTAVSEAPPNIYKPSIVTKKTESSTTQGFGLVFIDRYADGETDTISILIPPPVAQAAAPKEKAKSNEQKFLDIPVTVQQSVTHQQEVKNTDTKSNVCKSVATEDDFKKLRKKMVAKSTDDGMLDEAKKAFKQKCYTTSQLKNLGSLFLNDAARYQLFDAAYFYISDREKFSSLETEFKNDYYLRRFKAIIQP